MTTYTHARIATATGTVELKPITATNSFIAAQREAADLAAVLGRKTLYETRVVQIIGSKKRRVG